MNPSKREHQVSDLSAPAPSPAPSAVTAPDSVLKLYALIRADLNMPPGKLASQAGHAFVGAIRAADPQVQEAYHADGIGTKVCLAVPDLRRLVAAYEEAQAAGLPSVLIEDTGRNTTFGGVPTISAVGIGPLSPAQAKFLRRFPLLT